MADDGNQQTTEGLTDADFIELLWKCAYGGAELMPPTLPKSNLLREWSQWMEDATVERHRRETISKGNEPPGDAAYYQRERIRVLCDMEIEYRLGSDASRDEALAFATELHLDAGGVSANGCYRARLSRAQIYQERQPDYSRARGRE